MRAVISCLLVVGLLMPTVGMCEKGGVVVCRSGADGGREGQGSPCDSGLVARGGGGDTSSVVVVTDDGFWVMVVRYVVRVIVDGVIYETVKTMVKRSWERPPAPVNSPGWAETGCGMGAAGGSRY